MKNKMKVSAALAALCAATVWAGCGTCGGHDAGKKDAAACGAGGCDVKAEAKACDKGACDVKADAKACGKGGSCSSKKNDKGGVVNTAGVSALLNAKTPVVVLDARSGKYDDGKRLPGAKSLNADSPEAEIAKVLPDKKALVVTYCAGLSCPASGKLAEKLHKMGYNNVLEYAEGLEGWLKAGNAVENAK